jgi:hypothetical protein
MVVPSVVSRTHARAKVFRQKSRPVISAAIFVSSALCDGEKLKISCKNIGIHPPARGWRENSRHRNARQ